MASSSNRGGRKAGGKRKNTTTTLIDVNVVQPLYAKEYNFQRRSTGRLYQPALDFKNACGNRAVLVERLFGPTILAEIGFPYIQRFAEWKWWPLLFQKDNALSNVVKVFYYRGDNGVYAHSDVYGHDVRVGDLDTSFKTTLLDELINVDESLIRAYIGDVAAAGVAARVPKESEYPYVEACRDIYNDRGIERFENDASKMPLHNRILHLIVCQVLQPKGGGYNTATVEEIWWMHRIINNDPPNLAAFIVRHMLSAVRGSKSNQNSIGLPYGRLVSRICGALCSVHPQEPIATPEFKKPFGKNSISKLGWVFDATTRSYVRTRPENEDITLNSLMSEMRRMHTDHVAAVNNLNANMNERFGVLEQQQVALTQQQLVLSQQNQRLWEEFRASQPGATNNDPFPSFPSSSYGM